MSSVADQAVRQYEYILLKVVRLTDIRSRRLNRISRIMTDFTAIMGRRLPTDWTRRYNITPVLIETFVHTPRFTGAVYKASGWIHVGTIKGRGRYDTRKKRDKPKKDLCLRPLRRDWKRILNR